MVLYKRKPIAYAEPPAQVDDNAEVWVMRGSNEIFTTYDAYLERYDFYSQRNFTDAVTGKTNKSFFKALEHEEWSTNDIERIFPEALRAPILRRVQFSEIARMDDLVNFVFEEFRSDFFPGEEVSVVMEDGEVMECVVREKANFPELRNADGSVQRPAFARYFVTVKETQEQALLDDAHLKRGRNVFTKQNVRSYLKNCLQREAWIGAPWLVKEPLAQKYRLPMAIPIHLTQEVKTAQLRMQAAQARDSPATKLKKSKPAPPKPFSIDQLLQQDIEMQVKEESIKPEPPKYPIDDLDLDPASDGLKRPQLKFIAPLDGSPSADSGLRMDSVGPLLEVWNALTVHWDVYELDPFNFDDFVDAMKFSSPTVSCELFDEVHSAVLKLLVPKGGELDETLRDIVPIPDSEPSSETETPEQSEPATPVEPARSTRSRLSQVQTITDYPSPSEKSHKANQAAEMLGDRSWEERLQKRDLADGGWQVIMVGLLDQLALDDIWTSRVQPILSHLAPLDMPATQYTAQTQYTTLDVNHRITALQVITMLSLSTSTIRQHSERRNEEMTVIRKQKVDTQRKRKEHIRDLQRLELDRRENNPDAFVDDLADPKQEEVDTPILSNGHPSMDDSLSTNDGGHSDLDDDEASSRPLRRSNNARKRKRDEETAKRETERLERLERQKESADKVKKYKRILRDIDAMKKRVTDCELLIDSFDQRLREMNVARMRALGRDRFWNRWWWFERVGMQLDGRRRPTTKRAAPDDSNTEGYANARLWVQGPVELERRGFIDMDEHDQKAYAARHGMTVPERKRLEEGGEVNGVATAQQWGYIDDPDAVDALLGWLDERGRREKDLRKELLLWREDIVVQMDVLRASLHPDDASSSGGHTNGNGTSAADATADDPDAEDHHSVAAAARGPRTRVSTRNRTYLDTDDVAKRWRCLRWRNTRAAGKTGRHCVGKAEPAHPQLGKGGKPPRGAAAAAAAAKKARLEIESASAPLAGLKVEKKGQGQGQAQSTRSGAGGKGIAVRVASRGAGAGIAKALEAEKVVERETRGRGGRRGEAAAAAAAAAVEEEEERGGAKEGVQTRRSLRSAR